MVEQSGSEKVSVRFGAYIKELREFLSSRGVRFGSPEDVVGFAGRVAEPGNFQDEMGSLVRSILFRDNEYLGRGELLELVAVAVGGPEVETAAQEMHASVRQMFVFVNEALRQRQRMIPGEMTPPEEHPVTAGDILAAGTAARAEAEERALAGRVPENGFYAGTEETRGSTAAGETGTGAPERGGMLFKAVSMSEAERERLASGEPGDSHEPGPRRPWLIPAVLAVLLLLAAGAYFAKITGGRTADRGGAAGVGALGNQSAPVSAGACVGSPSGGSTPSAVQERAHWAHNLLDQKLYEAALPELREVARLDPGFPGVNLDESDALLQMKRPEDAREAVDTQLGISECLAKLPSPALDAYCSAEFSPSTVGGCRAQLAHVRQAAELQAALVHLELGHRAGPDGGATEAAVPDANPATPPPASDRAPEPAPVARVRRTPPLPPATEGNSAQPPAAVSALTPRKATGKTPSERKSAGDETLRRGEGTDSAFGAYSKPQ